MNEKRLINRKTGLATKEITGMSKTASVKTILESTPFYGIMTEFLAITRIMVKRKSTKHNIT